ncbi:MAG: sensor histidine kinase [Chloroflexota bacterium]|nr:sensor histidine kinase [Chloroflexota bacterium]
MKRFTRPFRQLRGKLTLSYTLTSVVTFLFLELIFIAVVLWYVNFNFPGIILDDLKKEALQTVPYFVHSSPDRAELTRGLYVIEADLPNLGPPGQSHTIIFLAVVDTQGQTIASIGSHPVRLDTPIQAQLSPQSQANLQAVLNDGKGTTGKVDQEADNTLLAETPIVGNGGNIQGVLVMKIAKPDTFQLLADFLQLIIVTCIVVTTIAAIAGMVFGYLTARGITRRLKRLSTAADMWGRGDFSALTHDASQDELGQVARQLNRMAEQLQNLLQARQKLATLEERNRLARDLHDSVKQQVFAVSMQIGATKVLLKRDVAAAEVRLNEAEKLVQQAQQELTSLIRELRPVALEGKGLAAALRELATQWTQQTDIVANLLVEGAEGAKGAKGTQGTQTLPLAVEEALFRVAQEALANVARHSKATLVQMILTINDTVTFSVADNGQGFDTTHQGQLGVGLLSMQERMKALGGDMQVESTPGKGTRIVAHCKRLGSGAGNGTANGTAAAGDEDIRYRETRPLRKTQF